MIGPHICPICSWQCTCSDQPCSCCKDESPKDIQHYLDKLEVLKEYIAGEIDKYPLKRSPVLDVYYELGIFYFSDNNKYTSEKLSFEEYHNLKRPTLA